MDLTGLELPEKRVLRALFELAQRDHPARPDVLARVLALDPAMLERVLHALAMQRLVDAARARLTLSGLAVAARLPALPRATFLLHLPDDAQDDEPTLGAC